MTATNITLRLDKGLKEQAEELFSDLGLSFSAAVNLFIRKALRTQGIPFDVDRAPARLDRIALGSAFDQLMASDEAQGKIGGMQAGSPNDCGVDLSAEEIEQAVAASR